MSQLTDKEVFDFFNRLFPGGINKIYENKKGGLVIDIDNLCDQIFTNTQGITWSYPSRQYPPPAEKLEPCRYCKAGVSRSGEIVQHPHKEDCILSGKCFKYKEWPKIPATNKDSLLVQNVDGAPQCKWCKDSGKVSTDLHKIDCPDCGGSTIAKHTTPTLESLGLNPVEVWENAPGWSIEIILQKWENGKIVPYFTGKYQTKSLRDPITLPPGTDWKKCIWKRPKEKAYCKYCLDAKTVPDDGGNGWVPCPECSL